VHDTIESAVRDRSSALSQPEPSAEAAPNVITRDADGRATVRAARVNQPLRRIDGALDEARYRDLDTEEAFTPMIGIGNLCLGTLDSRPVH